MNEIVKRMNSAGGVIVDSSGMVVIVKQGNGEGATWSLPKGKVEDGEDFVATAKREIYEETGIMQLEYVKEFPPYARSRRDLVGSDVVELHKTLHFFLFRSDTKDLKPIDADNPEARWVSKREALEMLSNPKDREFFQSVMNEF